MNEEFKLSARLRCAASMVREGSFVADVGTDHAYLPIALALEGKIRGAVASDINAGPVERGRKNIEEHALTDRISVVMTDGLSGIEPYAPNDILILGMGGELIARILECAPWTKDQSIRLCLQPMTHAEALRSFLLDNGYSIIDEQLAEALLLDFPRKVLCSEDCPGLCPKCGKSLKGGDCGCPKKEIDPRLAVLATLLQKEDEE